MQQEPERRRRAWPAALLLTFLAVLVPELTLAPASATEPQVAPHGVRIHVPARGPLDGLDDVDGTGAIGLAVRPVADSAAPPDPALAGRYQAALDAARLQAQAFGVTFAVVRDGTALWQGASGVTDADGPALEAASPLIIGSITKTFVAAAVLQLVDEGRVGLDHSVRRYLPELEIDRAITVSDLLDHTSGLADLFNDTTRVAIEEHPERAWTTEQLLATLHEPWYGPGEGWAYANTNYLLLSLLVERVSGASLDEELTNRFFGPLGLDATRLIAASGSDQALAPAWATIFWGSGAMVSSASDVARWGDALYGDTLLDRGTLRRMLRVNENEHGLGVQRLAFGDLVGYGHTGLLDHYTSLLLYLPQDDVTLAILVNRGKADLWAMLSAHPDAGPSLIELATDP